MVLIVGAHIDPHVTSVAKHLEQFEADYIILDRFDYEKSGSVVMSIGENAVLHLGAGRSLKQVSSVWWRQKPPFIVPNGEISEYYNSIFANQEWNHIQKFIEYKLKNIFSINDPIKSLIVHNKLYQLDIAVTAGFAVPKTIFSNNFNVIDEFIKSVEPNKVVFKTLTAYMNPSGLLTYTTIVNRDIIQEKIKSISIAPGIYQEYVRKKFELRITIVGNKIFAAKIKTSFGSDASIDWRSEISEDMYENYELPSKIHTNILKLHKDFGLAYGAYDFILDETNNFVFLEVNPSGQWLWLERKLDQPISYHIAKLLMEKKY